MTDITELAQRNELLIANGQQTADLLRHLADNEIDSDYFAVVSECESYGKETDAELSITEFALRAAGYVDALVEALETGNTENERMAREIISRNGEIEGLRRHIAELESRTVTVKLPEPFKMAKSSSGLTYYYADEVNEALTAQGIKWEAE